MHLYTAVRVMQVTAACESDAACRQQQCHSLSMTLSCWEHACSEEWCDNNYNRCLCVFVSRGFVSRVHIRLHFEQKAYVGYCIITQSILETMVVGVTAHTYTHLVLVSEHRAGP